MKHLLTISFFLIPILLSAQQKIGHVDMDKVIRSMPEFTLAEDSVQMVGKDLQKELMRQQEELQAYYKQTMTQVQQGDLTPVQQQEAEGKLQKMQEDLQKKGQEFDLQIATLENELMGEIQARIEDALIIHGRENGFAYILDLSQILYFGGGIDVTEDIIQIVNQ
jgi:outer membrane protein